jgi:FtsP/CotA-like multicopper oxidase with cupredoxin domain
LSLPHLTPKSAIYTKIDSDNFADGEYSILERRGRALKATRRQLLKIIGGAATASLRPGLLAGVVQILGGCGGGGSSDVPVSAPSGNPVGTPLRIPPVLDPVSTTATDDLYDLSVREEEVEILPGKATRIIGFEGITPGPTIRARAGRPVTVTLSNDLPQATLGGTPGEVTIHLHGGHVPASEDGFPTDAVQPGTSRTYTYPNNQLPSTLWYHDHLMDYTGPHVWYGMAGFYLITDDHEESLGLPSGAYEVPLVIQDRTFDGNGNLVYTGNPDGELGNSLLVNGTVDPYFRVATRKYRFRILNGSNMRAYRLALNSGQPFLVLGMEGGLLPSPVTVSSLFLAPAERADVVIDFSPIPVGQNLVLGNLLGAGDTVDVLRLEVDRQEPDDSLVPPFLRPLEGLNESEAVRTRRFTLSGGMMGMPGMMGGSWTINGKPFDPDRVDADPKLDTMEIWEFQNMSMMDHPVHVHQSMFQILDINRVPPPATHAGWKDTVNVPAMGTARIIIPFPDYIGRYVFHCHVLEHEDRSMMARFDVVP